MKKKRIRVKREVGEKSPIPPIMQNYIAAVVKAAIDELGMQSFDRELRSAHIMIRIMYTILLDLQASANLAASATQSSKQTLREFIENMQASLGHNLGMLHEMQQDVHAEIDVEAIIPLLSGVGLEDVDQSAIDAVLENLRAQAAHNRGPEGEDFDDENDMIENAMEDVDVSVDLTREEGVGERLRRRMMDHDVRGSGGTRQSQRRRRSAT